MPKTLPVVLACCFMLAVLLLMGLAPSIGAMVWSNTEVVSTESTSSSMNPSIAVGPDGTVHVVWYDATDYNGSGTDADIFYKSYNGTWSGTSVVSTESTSDSVHPSIAVGPDGTVHVVWHDFTDYLSSGTDADIFYKSYNGTWSTTVVVSTESTLNSVYPSIAVGPNGKVHIVWTDYTDYAGSGIDSDIFYKSYNGTWSGTSVVSTESTSVSIQPSIAVGPDGTLHVVWTDHTDYAGSGIDPDIFYRSYNGTWSGTSVVSIESTENSYAPSLSVGPDGTVHVVWHDETEYGGSGYDRDIFYKSYNGTWSGTTVVSTESTDNSYDPSIAVGPDGTVHVVWHDYTEYSNSGTDCDIFYKSYNGTWSTTTLVSTESTATSELASIAVGPDGTVYVVWQDYTEYSNSGTDSDIFYRALAPFEISIILTQETQENASFNYAAEANDNVSIWSLTTNATFPISINNSTGMISATPGTGQNGSYWVNVTAISFFNEIDTKNFTLYVLPLSTIVSAPVEDGTDNSSYLYQAVANIVIPSGNWSLQSNASFLTINSTGAVINTSATIPGIYYVNVSATSSHNVSGWQNYTLTVTDAIVPTANAGVDQTINEGTIVTFDGTASTDNVAVTNYTWNFSYDGTTVTLYGASPTHNFSIPGNYTVTLTVKDASNNTGTDTMFVNVTDLNPVANAGIDQTVDQGTTVTFDGSGSYDSAVIDNFTWTFTYDGETVTLYGVSPICVFEITGNYTVTLTVKDATQNSATDTMMVNVNDNTDPVADAGLDQNVDKWTVVTFNGTGSTDNVVVTNYTWTFTYDGNTVTLYGVSPSHNFSIPGNYTVTLTVKDAADNTGTDIMTVNVNDLWAPTITSSSPSIPVIGSFVTGLGFEHQVTVNESSTYTMDTDATFLNISTNGTISGTLQYGTYYVNVSATSMEGKLVTWQNFTITVVNGTWVNGTINGPDDNPLPGVEIWIDGVLVKITDADGKYSFLLIDGDYEMEIVREGFISQTIGFQVSQNQTLLIDSVSMLTEDDNNALFIGALFLGLIIVVGIFYLLIRRRN